MKKETKLIRQLKILGTVYSSNYEFMKLVYNEVNIDKAVVLSKRWCNWYKDNTDIYPLDLKNFNNWITYSGCVDLIFTYSKTDGFICNVTIYNGELLDGYRTDKRFETSLLLDVSFITFLEHIIDGDFYYYCEKKHKEFLENLKRDWVREYSKKILGDIK
jgi:hypothetical protein